MSPEALMATAAGVQPEAAGWAMHDRRRRSRRRRAVGVLCAAVLVVSACSSSKSSTGGSNASTSPLGQKAPGGDIGVTNAEIRVAVIADVQTSINPGLFQKSINAVKAW